MTKRLFVSSVCVSLLSIGALMLLFPERAPTVVPVEPKRGQLVDVNSTPLTAGDVRWQPAINVEALREYPPASVRRFISALAKELGFDAERLADMDGRLSTQVKERQVPARVTESRMNELRVWLSASEWRASPRLLRFIEMPARMYPQRELTANLIGFVDRDGNGQEGMERELDETLREGREARLSIDVDLQRRLADTLQQAIDTHAFSEANVVVIKLATQRIASLVSLPSFDPAIAEQRVGPQIRLKPATDVYQAGPMLEPFFLNEVLSSSIDDGPNLRTSFVRGERVGTRMVNALGYESARASLEYVELLRGLDIDFPGAVHTLERRSGTPAELLRDLGNGAGVAPSLLRYSTSFVSLIDGRPLLPTRILIASTPPAPLMVSNDRATRAQALRAAMVERARRQVGYKRADFGGMWASYDDRVENGEPVHRAALALFGPAAQPKQVVAATFITKTAIDDAQLLAIGVDLLDAALER